MQPSMVWQDHVSVAGRPLASQRMERALRSCLTTDNAAYAEANPSVDPRAATGRLMGTVAP
jgi:hypothetical protein